MQSDLAGIQLERVPLQEGQPLRAWDAADEYVLDELSSLPDGNSIALVNDSFGALSTHLRSHDPFVFNESAAGREAIAGNLVRNELAPIDVLSMLDLVGSDLPEFDHVVIKVPKSAGQLVDLLYRLRPHLSADTRVVGAAMAKHIHTSTLEHFEEIIGPTTTSLARKKARLIHATVDPDLDRSIGKNPWPKKWKANGVELTNHGGGFSPDQLDRGTRRLLDAVGSFDRFIDSGASSVRVVDLGCGNGILGLVAARDLTGAGHEVAVEAIDDSALAIDAARHGWEGSGLDADVQFHHHHRMVEVLDANSADLIIVNPPFHDDRHVGDHVAWSMFVDSHKVLRRGGSLVVVGNRHLAYHAKLMKIFGNVEELAADKRFVVQRTVR